MPVVLIENPGINLGPDDMLYYDVDPITHEAVANFSPFSGELLNTSYTVHKYTIRILPN